MSEDGSTSDSTEHDRQIQHKKRTVNTGYSDGDQNIPEAIDTEQSQEILYDTIHNIVRRSAKRRKRRRTVKTNRRKKQRGNVESACSSDELCVPRARSRCSVPYFFEIIKFIRQVPRFVDLVKGMGFGHLLELDDCYVPRAFVQWIADHTIPEDEVIRFEGSSIKLSEESVTQSLGLPAGHLPVETDEQLGKTLFLSAFALTDIPTIKYFGNKILFEKNLSDVDFCRCFMVVCNATFLCPNSSTKPSTKYLGALVDVEQIKERNWGKFVHEWLILAIKKYLLKKKRHNNLYMTLGGCIYHLAVRCLDFLDFYPIKLPNTMPRIHVWKGDMIKNFSDMTIGKDGKYGARQFIQESATCYAQGEISEPHTVGEHSHTINEAKSTDKKEDLVVSKVQETVRNSMASSTHDANTNFNDLCQLLSASTISDKLKERIVSAFETSMKDEHVSVQTKAAALVLDVINLLAVNNGESGDTEKLESSHNNQISSAARNDSQSTMKISSHGSEDEESNEAPLARKPRKNHHVVSSQQSVRSGASNNNERAKLICKPESVPQTQPHIAISENGTIPNDGTTLSATVNPPPHNTSNAGENMEQSHELRQVKDNGGTSASLNYLLQRNCSNNNSSENQILPGLIELPAQPKISEDSHERRKKTEFLDFQNNLDNTQGVDIQHETQNVKQQIVKIEGGTGQHKHLLPDVMVSVHIGNESTVGVIKEVLQDETCVVLIQTSGTCNELTVSNDNVELIEAKKHDNIKILYGPMCGSLGSIIGLDGCDAIVRVEGVHELKVLQKVMLGRVQEIKNRNLQITANDNVKGKPHADMMSYTEWWSFIDKARQKYFFKDDSTPSYRLFEHEDDNGKTIDECVLWRPLGMNSEQYEQKIQIAKHNYMVMDRSFQKPKPDSINSKRTTSMFNESNIQCAQKQKSYCDLTSSTEVNRLSTAKDPLIAQSNSNLLSTSSTKSSVKTPSSTRYFKDEIVGRVLFPDDKENYAKSSQDIQYLRTNTFSATCKKMGDQTDQLYNKSFSLGSGSSSSCKENIPPKRIVMASRYYNSPYDNNDSNSRQPITANEQKIYEAITTLCDDEDYCLKWAIYMDNCKVTLEQFGRSFKKNGHVEAFVINAFCRKLFKDDHPRNSGKHFFFNTASDYFLEKWKTEDGRLDLKEKTFKQFKGAALARPLHLVERLNFPSVWSDHWFLFCVDIKARNFLFLDSFYGKHDSFHVIASDLLIRNFKTTWQETGQKAINFDNFDIVYPVVPRQKGGDNCGIHCMKLMELYCPRNPAQYAYSDDDVPYFRIRYAIDNLFTKHNTENSVKNLVCNIDIKKYKEQHQVVQID